MSTALFGALKFIRLQALSPRILEKRQSYAYFFIKNLMSAVYKDGGGLSDISDA